MFLHTLKGTFLEKWIFSSSRFLSFHSTVFAWYKGDRTDRPGMFVGTPNVLCCGFEEQHARAAFVPCTHWWDKVSQAVTNCVLWVFLVWGGAFGNWNIHIVHHMSGYAMKAFSSQVSFHINTFCPCSFLASRTKSCSLHCLSTCVHFCFFCQPVTSARYNFVYTLTSPVFRKCWSWRVVSNLRVYAPSSWQNTATPIRCLRHSTWLLPCSIWNNTSHTSARHVFPHQCAWQTSRSLTTQGAPNLP